MRKLLVCLVLFASIMVATNNAYAKDDCKNNPRACFDGFDDDGEIDPKDKAVKRTFEFPAIKAGFLIDFKAEDILPQLAVEAFDFSVPKLGDFTVDVGVAKSRVFSSLTWELLPVVKVGPSIWAGYNVVDDEPTFGIGFTVLKF